MGQVNGSGGGHCEGLGLILDVRFVEEKVALEWGFSQYLCLPCQ